jgi:hypothetical protein
MRFPIQSTGASRQISPVLGHAQAVPSLNNSIIPSGVVPAQSGFNPWGFNPWGLADPCLLWAQENGFDSSICYGSGGGPTNPGPGSTPYPPGSGGSQTKCTLCTLSHVAAISKCAGYKSVLGALICTGLAQMEYQRCTRRHCT